MSSAPCPLCAAPADPARCLHWSHPQFRVLRCPGCGMLFKEPRASTASTEALLGAVYGGEGVSGRALHQARHLRSARARLQLLGPLAPGARLLEVGIGGGELLHEAQKRGLVARGVELSRDNAAYARATYGVQVFEGLLGDYQPERPFDVAVLSHVIEHLREPVALLRELRQRLAPGGRLLILAPNFEGLWALLLQSAWANVEQADHVALFGPASLRAAVERAGLSVVRLWTEEGDTDLIGALLWRLAPSRQRHLGAAAAGPPSRGAAPLAWLRRLSVLRQAPYLLGAATAPLSWPARALLGRADLGSELRCLARA